MSTHRVTRGWAGNAGRLLRFAAAAALLAACTTSPLGRQQLRLFPESEMDRMGGAAFLKLREEMRESGDSRVDRSVRCVADALIAQLEPEYARRRWEVVVFDEPSANAFALPGGKIGVHTGLLKVAQSQSQLATVLGHEVYHVVAGHANERISTTFVTQSGLELVQMLSGAPSPGQSQLMGLLGVGAQVGVLLPFNRKQESEADLLGLDLMARAGFEPRESVQLWMNMERAGGAAPPEFLSTHPSSATRIRSLQERMASAMRLRDAARASGRNPRCS